MNNMNYFGNAAPQFAYGYGPAVGAPYGGANPTPANLSGVTAIDWLTPEESNRLNNNSNKFSLQVTEDDQARAICNHVHNGHSTLITNEDGSLTCTRCGYTFRADNSMTELQVKDAVQLVEDILQTTKLMYLSLDSNVAREYYQIIAFLRKIPNLYKVASEDFKRYENVFGFINNVPANAFAIFGSMTNPMGGAYYGMPQANMPGMMPNQQMMSGMPQANMPGMMPNQQMMGQPYNGMMPNQQMMGGNPFYQGAYAGQPNQQMMMGQPNPNAQQGFSVNAQGAAAQSQQVTATQTGTAEKDVKVDGNFKN